MRDPEITRQKILDVAAAEIHGKGFKATSLSDILAAAKISKGALYHHFSNKQELGMAVMEEVYMPMFMRPWEMAASHEDPLGAMVSFIRRMPSAMSDDELAKGCPVTNMCSEMATSEAEVRDKSNSLFQRLAGTIAKGMKKSGLRDDVDPICAALFLITSLNGMSTLIKSSQSREMLSIVCVELVKYLESLRSEASAAAAKARGEVEFEMPDCSDMLEQLRLKAQV